MTVRKHTFFTGVSVFRKKIPEEIPPIWMVVELPGFGEYHTFTEIFLKIVNERQMRLITSFHFTQ